MSTVIDERDTLLAQITAKRIVPVVKLDRAEDARPLAEALLTGGLPVAEITFRTAAAEKAICEAARVEGMVVGAGTVTSVRQARLALDAGARFLVTPGFSEDIARFCAERRTLLLPGAATASELMLVVKYGLPVAKFFPAAQCGGLSAIRALSAPFPGIRFMPTGGISAANLAEYLAFDRVAACGGSWMVKDSLINEGNYGEIKRLTQEAVSLAASV